MIIQDSVYNVYKDFKYKIIVKIIQKIVPIIILMENVLNVIKIIFYMIIYVLRDLNML